MAALKDLEPKKKDLDLDIARNTILDSLPTSFAILNKHFKSKDLMTSSKGSYVDIVTEADMENEQFWKKVLLGNFPQTQFLGEESAADGYNKLLTSPDWLWVVDPLDGTVNFSRGNPNFALSVALVKEGKTKLGVVGIPERNEIYFAQENRVGAFSMDGQALEISLVKELKKASLRCDWVYNLETRQKLSNLLNTLAPQVRQVLSGGSAVADIIDLALGRADIYFNPGLKPWDIAAACYIVEKAGGKVTDLKAKNWNVFESDLLLSNGYLHQEVLKIIVDSEFKT